MRILFLLDKNDHADCKNTFVRNSARSIIISDKKVAMIYSRKYGYYKFPGGGIEAGETPVEAVIRETREEAGLTVVPESVKEYGIVHRVQRSDKYDSTRFIQDNYYYLCKVESKPVPTELDDYEAKEGFVTEYVEPEYAIKINKKVHADNTPYNEFMFERETRVLEMLISEGYFG